MMTATKSGQMGQTFCPQGCCVLTRITMIACKYSLSSFLRFASWGGLENPNFPPRQLNITQLKIAVSFSDSPLRKRCQKPIEEKCRDEVTFPFILHLHLTTGARRRISLQPTFYELEHHATTKIEQKSPAFLHLFTICCGSVARAAHIA